MDTASPAAIIMLRMRLLALVSLLSLLSLVSLVSLVLGSVDTGEQQQQCIAQQASTSLPVIDVSPLTRRRSSASVHRNNGNGNDNDSDSLEAAVAATAQQIYAACTSAGFFYVTNHGVPEHLQRALAEAARQFFALPLEQKRAISMQKGGKAWRGYFAPGEELTKGLPDGKEGVYFGEELPADHPKVLANTPMHGANLYPDDAVPQLRPLVEEYMREMQALGEAIIEVLQNIVRGTRSESGGLVCALVVDHEHGCFFVTGRVVIVGLACNVSARSLYAGAGDAVPDIPLPGELDRVSVGRRRAQRLWRPHDPEARRGWRAGGSRSGR